MNLEACRLLLIATFTDSLLSKSLETEKLLLQQLSYAKQTYRIKSLVAHLSMESHVHLFKVKQWLSNFKVPLSRLFLLLQVSFVKQIYMKS